MKHRLARLLALAMLLSTMACHFHGRHLHAGPPGHRHVTRPHVHVIVPLPPR